MKAEKQYLPDSVFWGPISAPGQRELGQRLRRLVDRVPASPLVGRVVDEVPVAVAEPHVVAVEERHPTPTKSSSPDPAPAPPTAGRPGTGRRPRQQRHRRARRALRVSTTTAPPEISRRGRRGVRGSGAGTRVRIQPCLSGVRPVCTSSSASRASA